MNVHEHLLALIGEEGVEVAHIASKALRFGIEDRNVLNPGGPTNRERLVAEMNDFAAVASLLVQHGIIPANWFDCAAQKAKLEKVLKFMAYARTRGSLG